MPSGMFYDSGEEVQLGDRVQVKRLFGKAREGYVCYIPRVSPPHSELEYEYVRKWAIKLDDGTVLASAYNPQKFQPGKKVVFIRRTDFPGIGPDEKLE